MFAVSLKKMLRRLEGQKERQMVFLEATYASLTA